ncbi:MAG: ribosome recycling factor [Patescibacteria group bacterium]
MPIETSTYKPKLQATIDHLSQELSNIRTGKASVQMLDSVMVEAYGTRMKLNEVGNVSVLDAHMLTITPWDKSLLANIEKAIQIAQLNLSPIIDGEIVRVPVPPLNQERRQELVKLVHQKAESTRVMVRNQRVEFKKEIEAQQGEAGVSEDDVKRQLKELEEIIKEYLEKIDRLIEIKEKDLLTI